ncbi:MAG: hypothetical protein MRZ35_02590 [Firmicutes bacterium]|nr:hypothetical protein [Bacillota bacterium]
MVSKKELEYVNQYARLVPFPGVNYARDAMETLIEAYKTYVKNYQGKIYNFIFSNGEEINFQIFEKNLAHLFGIDYKNLTSDAMQSTTENVLDFKAFQTGGAEELLKRIVDRADDIIKNDSKPNNYRILNYYRILIKCSAFSKLSTFKNFNFGCINFDKYIYESTNGTLFGPQSTKFFFVPSNEAVTPYFMMGIRKDNGNDIYIPETIFSSEGIDKMINCQTFILPIQILINDNYELTKIVATPKEKLDLLNLYKSLIGMYQTNTFIDIYNDYENTLRENKELKLR